MDWCVRRAQGGGSPAGLRGPDHRVDGPHDLHSGARQHKRRNNAGTGICTRKKDQRVAGNVVYIRHAETYRDKTEDTWLGIRTGRRKNKITFDAARLRKQYLGDRQNCDRNKDRGGEDSGRHGRGGLETGRDGELLINRHKTQRPPPGITDVTWNGAELKIIEGMAVLGFRLNPAGTDTDIRK